MTSINKKGALPQAVILAGGKGVRLRPLTEDLPKPLLPVGEKPLLEMILENLEEEGVRDVLILTGYKSDAILKYVRGCRRALNVSCLPDDGGNGSAGSLKRAAPLLDDCFFVVSGDIYGRRRYRGFYEFYEQSGADAGILLSRVSDPGEYGVVSLDRNGRVLQFVEKPRWSQVFSDTVNAGIYLFKKSVLEEIPDGVPFDVGGGLLPKLLEKKRPVCGYFDKGLWRDVGDLSTYLACCLCENGGESLFLPGARAEEGAQVSDSLLFDGAVVKKGSVVNGAILSFGALVEEDCVIPAGCVLGSGSTVKKGSVLPPGAILPPGAVYPSGRLADPLSSSSSGTLPSERNGRPAPALHPYDPESGDPGALSPVRLKELFSSCVLPPKLFLPPLLPAFCRALSECAGSGPVGVFTENSPPARALAQRIRAELCRFCRTAFCGDAFEAQAASVCSFLQYPFSLFVFEDGRSGVRVKLLDSRGFVPPGTLFRRLRDLTGEFLRRRPAPFSPFVFEDVSRDAEARYLSFLKSLPGCRLAGLRVGLGNGAPERLLFKVLLLLGADVTSKGKGDCTVLLSRDGARAEILDRTGKLDGNHLLALLLRRETQMNGPVPALPFRLPRALFRIASADGREAQGFPLTPADDRYENARRAAAPLRFLFDGCAAALLVLPALLSSDCRRLLDTLPPFFVLEKSFDCAEEEKLGILIKSRGVPAGEGVERLDPRGRSLLRALDRRGMHLQVEAAKESDCAELFGKMKDELDLD